jgi:hypothetical protein
MLKAYVTWRRPGRWEVYEQDTSGGPLSHHSFHRTEAEARATARAQNKINKREAGLPCLSR